MKKKYKFILGFFILLFLANCTVQKRTFNKGYFVQWHHKTNKQIVSHEREDLSVIKTEDSIDEIAKNELVYISVEESTIPEEEIVLSKINVNKRTIFSQDKVLQSMSFFTNSVSAKLVQSLMPSNKSLQKHSQRDNKKEKFFFEKEKGRKALLFLILSMISILLFSFLFWLVLISNFSYEKEFIGYILIFLVIATFLGTLIFPILSLIYLISAFIKPKNTETSS